MTGFMQLPTLPPVVYGSGEDYPLFTRISLETCGLCNRTCSFCPSYKRERRLNLMPQELYNSICDQLRALEWNGAVQFFYLNEPLLDKRILDLLRQLREACPRCSIHVTSNGEVVRDRDFLYALFRAGVNILNLNGYTPEAYAHNKSLCDSLWGLHNIEYSDTHVWAKVSPRKRILSCSDLTNPTGLHSWQDEEIARTNDMLETKSQRCARPHRHLVIQYDGKIPLCCAQDPMKPTASFMGDLTQGDTLVSVWNSYEMFKYRLNLQHGKRVDLCSGCNEKMAFPHIVRKVEL